jgi:hypothetical protein
MPVTVRTTGPRADKLVHADADDITVDDAGNLVLTAREGRGERVVAVHASGFWTSAETGVEVS